MGCGGVASVGQGMGFVASIRHCRPRLYVLFLAIDMVVAVRHGQARALSVSRLLIGNVSWFGAILSRAHG